MHRSGFARRATVSASTLALLLTLGACTPDDDDSSASGSTTEVAGEGTAAPSDSSEGGSEQSAEPMPEPQAPDPGEGAWPTTDSVGNPDLGPEASLIPTAVQYECSTEADGASASGTVANSSEDARDLLITVLWVAEDGAMLATATQTFAEVPGGESVDFEVEASLDDDAQACNYKAQSAPTGTLTG